MINIKKIKADQFNEALKHYFNKASVEEFWEVKGVYASDNDLCWISNDGSCFYYLETNTCNFVYFAFDTGRMTNIKGMYEALYECVCAGHPYIRINGKKGKYPKLLKAFDHYQSVNTRIKENDEVIWYVAHPENIEKIKRRFN